MRNYTRLLRIGQWYKNLLIFLPLLFASADNVQSIEYMLLGFVGFCSVSSITYMINDWIDREADRLHPTKKHRPLASGAISGKTACFVGGILASIVIISALYLGTFYAAVIGTYFVITNAYSFGLKHIPLVDLLIIAGNFTLRTLAGMTSFPQDESLYYFVGIFSVICLFLTHKRRSDIKLLGEKAVSHKPVLRFYTKRNSYLVRLIGYAGVVYVGYALWKIGVPQEPLLFIFGLLVLTSVLMSKNPTLALKPHYLLKNWMWDVGLLLVGISIFLF